MSPRAATSQRLDVGGNRTGVAIDPKRAEEMMEAYQEFGPTSHTGKAEIEREHAEQAKEAPPLGSLPPPRKGAKLDAAKPSVAMLMDKLGERLAFERIGARLYEGVIAKVEGSGSFDGGPTREQLEEIRAEERSHFELLRRTITQLGGDPTAVTPAANVAALSSMGVGKVIGDPRTNLLRCLDALLVAELTDNASWEMLIDLAHQAGEDDILPAFERALQREEEHLSSVRHWLQAGHGIT